MIVSLPASASRSATLPAGMSRSRSGASSMPALPVSHSMTSRRCMDSGVSEADVGEEPARPPGQIPGAGAHQAQQHGEQQQADERGVEQHGDAEDDPHL